jgi:hypothetical protein
MPPDDRDDAPSRHSGSQFSAIRAGVVVVCFVVATIVLLGPASHLTAGVPLSSTTTTTHPQPPVVRHLVSVQVANGTTTKNLAGHYTQYLSNLTWNALPAADTLNGFHPSHSIVYFAIGFQAAAREVATELGLRPRTAVRVRTPVASHRVANADQVDVVVILGHDLAG